MPEAGSEKEPREQEPAMVSMARYSGLGLQLAASVVVFMLGGRWLDGKLGTGGWLTLLGALLGGAAGFYSLFRQVVKRSDQGRPR